MAEVPEKPERRFPIGKLVAAAVLLPFALAIGAVIVGTIYQADKSNSIGKAINAQIDRDLTRLLFAAEAFRNSTGRYPQYIEEMFEVAGPAAAAGVAWLAEFPRDPWGEEYRYRLWKGKPMVRSCGFDGEIETHDDRIKTADDLGPVTMEKITEVIRTVRSIYIQPGPLERMDISKFLEHLKSGDETVQRSAITSLAQMGTTTKTALLALTGLLKSEDRRCRWLAAGALKESGPAAGAVASEVITILNDRNQDLDKRHCAAFALGGFGRWAAKVAVPALVNALKDPGRDVPVFAAMALAEIGPAAVAAVPALTEALDAGNDGVRLFAASALGNIGAEAGSAVPALTKALEHEDEQVRQAATEALAKIQEEAAADAGEPR